MTNASKLANLQNALNKTRGATPAVQEARAVNKPVPVRLTPPTLTRQANRQDKVNIAAWMHPDFKRSLRLVQARRGGNIQDLLGEALNDLFAKYDVPQVTPSEGA
ncbi:MAG: ribbon-helix-helix domain-containing protein [Rhodopila sp.]